ncbi:hypothetical protein PL371_04990 [Tenacibaculum maritimum]|nr:hypothetical protein [Tenacibaculum maritimum]MDB0611236.1 hypothetical protein [Tenacibaculum maritimum]
MEKNFNKTKKWAIKMRESITGGTVFWLNSGIDRGDIAYQDFTIIDPQYFSLKIKVAARRLWRDSLQPMGFSLMDKALSDISNGIVKKRPQKEALSTFEPSMEVKDIYKPDLLMIEENASKGNF